MAAATAARDPQRKEADLVRAKMAQSTTIYQGTLAAYNASGLAVPGADTANFVFAGVAYETVTSPASAATYLRVERTGTYVFNFTGTATQATVGQKVYLSDDNTVAVAATTTNDVYCGDVVEFLSATSVRIRIDLAAA
jgi:hypothetical protein